MKPVSHPLFVAPDSSVPQAGIKSCITCRYCPVNQYIFPFGAYRTNHGPVRRLVHDNRQISIGSHIFLVRKQLILPIRRSPVRRRISESFCRFPSLLIVLSFAQPNVIHCALGWCCFRLVECGVSRFICTQACLACLQALSRVPKLYGDVLYIFRLSPLRVDSRCCGIRRLSVGLSCAISYVGDGLVLVYYSQHWPIW